ncbi:MAG TPA: hypothetical protein VIV27_06155 [Halioglobus sp.]
MMNGIKLALIGLTLGSAASMAGECAAPTLPTLPAGATASKDQMLAGQKAVKDFQAANSEYRACLQPQIDAAQVAAAGDSPSEAALATLKQLNDEYNGSVSKEEELATQFNTTLREYKAANPG